MKKLIRRLSRIADSLQYSLLRSEPQSPSSGPCKLDSSGIAKSRGSKLRSGAVPAGHFPVYVGEEMERFIVSAKLLNHPIFVKLLNKSAQEYGYEQKGVLHVPCNVIVFERLLEGLRIGDESAQDLIKFLSEDVI